MPNIIIDPVIIILPSANADRATVEVWLENLIVWLKEALTAPFTWLHYRQASVLLEANEQFPSFQQLKHLQQKHKLDFNVSQIARNVNAFFRDDALDLESTLKNLEYAVEYEAGSIIIQPVQFLTRLPEYIHNSLHILLADCCACKHINFTFGQELHIATLPLENASREIVISVVVLEAIPDFGRPSDNKIIQIFPLLITPDDLQLLANVTELWTRGATGIIYAIQQQCKMHQSGNLYNFRLGPHFIDSVNERGLDTNEIVLRSIIHAISDVISDRAKNIRGYRLHHFRKNETADSPQLVRESDQARAWRLMLQKHGAGWRLHYWQIATPEGSMIEFANVCKESEREIY